MVEVEPWRLFVAGVSLFVFGQVSTILVMSWFMKIGDDLDEE